MTNMTKGAPENGDASGDGGGAGPGPGPGPAVERFPVAALHSGEPFAVLYGPGADDVFVDHGHQVCSLEETLWRVLRAEGYERVVFSSLAEPVYFRDNASRDLSRAGGAAAAPRRGPRTMHHDRLRGPLGSMLVPGFGDRGAAGEPGTGGGAGTGGGGGGTVGTVPAPSTTGVSDPFGVMTLTGYLRRREHRTAVVFPYAEEILHYNHAGRQLAHAMADWAQQCDGRNLWVLVFRRASLERVAEFVADQGGFPLLETFVRQQRDTPGRPGTGEIGYPQAPEVERLIHATRLRAGLRIADWRELAPIVRAMAGQPVKTRTWRARLQQLAKGNGTLNANAVRGWVEAADTDPRTALERLRAMPGLEMVKRHFEELTGMVETARALEGAGHTGTYDPPSLHLVFTGNPGTGKTTVARLVGEIYRDLGLLRRGHVVEAKVRDLVSGYVGQTAERTDDAVDRALDGVLFVDEAYALSDQREGYGGQAIQALLSRMENDRGRLVVVAAGYPGKMREFLASDVGLSSRFPTVLDFPDYPVETLLAILLGRLTQRGETLDAATEEQLGEVVAEMYRTRDESFGNARDMRTLADDILRLWAARVRGRADLPITPEDIPEAHRPRLGRPIPDPVAQLAELDRYVGLDEVRAHFTTLGNRLRLRQAAGKGGFVAPHLVFTGPPGTGKTTVARVVGRMFRDLGLLRKGHVVEVTRAELVANFIGQTATRVQKAVRDALDGVLFIDEAYSLTRDTSSGRDFGQEAVDTLIREMEHRRGRLVVIVAGYPREMAQFLEANSGMASRFADPVVFPPYSGADLAEILRRMAADEGYTLGAGTADRAVRWLEWRRAMDPVGFGNARTVRGLLGEMEGRMAARLAREGWPDGRGTAAPLEFLPADVPEVPVSRRPSAG
ncbi:AAA family ATPase [Streptomyces sp. NPDC048340]|uniref:AAA family ATPase n=1 Tax=Streptomyces sp. NPDC048340 TaxID=3365537 RepID=UPI0037208614